MKYNLGLVSLYGVNLIFTNINPELTAFCRVNPRLGIISNMIKVLIQDNPSVIQDNLSEIAWIIQRFCLDYIYHATLDSRRD